MIPIPLISINQIPGYGTLSEVLKQTGIKEIKSKTNKKSINTKKKPKYYYEKYLKKDFEKSLNKIKQQKNPPKNMLSPIEKESSTEEIQTEKKESVNTKKIINEEEAINKSLDFIQECQKYKKKVTSPPGDWGMNNYSKSLGKYQNPYLNPGKGYQKSEGSITRQNKVQNANKFSNTRNDKSLTEYFPIKGPEKSKAKNNLNYRSENKFSRVSFWQKPDARVHNSGDVSTIDKKYLESLLSITKRTQPNKKPSNTEEEKIQKNQNSETHLQKKKKLPQQDTLMNMNDNNFQTKNSKNHQETLNKSPKNGEILPNTVRNLTKSEQQLKQNPDSRKSKVREKKVVSSKPIIGITRKKRSPRNKNQKNESKGFIETSIPGEVISANAIQELWSRTSKKNSENSLTSSSSINVPESDIKNLNSYKYLSKLVQDEISHILSKSAEKYRQEGIETVKSPEKKSEVPEKSKEFHNKLQKSLQEETPNLEIKSKIPFLKKKQQNTQLPTFFSDDKENNLEKKAKESGTLPSKVIENWFNLNRLEQAFLGLGTPTFQKQNKKLQPAPTVLNTMRDTKQKPQTTEKPLTQKSPKTKNVSVKKETKTPLNTNSRQTKQNFPTSGRTTQNLQNTKTQNEKPNIRNEKQPISDLKDSKFHKLQTNIMEVYKSNENQTKNKKNKKISSGPQKKVPGGKTTKKDDQTNPMNHSRQLLKISPVNATEIKLERTSTFSVVKLTPPKTVTLQHRKSKGSNKSDGNITISYSKMDNKINQTPTETTVMDQPKLCKSYGCEKGIRTTPKTTHKRLNKAIFKMESSLERENPKNSEEKPFLKENLEKSPKIVETTELQPCLQYAMESRVVNNISISDIPALPLKINNNNKVRAAKKRSILSVQANQMSNETNKMLQQIQFEHQFEEKNSFSTNSLNFRSQDTMKGINASQLTIIITQSNTSVTSTATYVNEFQKKCSSDMGSQQSSGVLQESSEMLPVWCTEVAASKTGYETQYSELNADNISLKKENWEKDLSHYHRIVRDIMSQYKRIDGLLKQSEKATGISSKVTGNDIKEQDESYAISLKEYRKRIISEYKALPSFEYKSKILENSEGNLHVEDGKRNLVVAKDSETFEDEDVKDSQPKMKKILDSQIYVEPENLTRHIEQKDKIDHKNSSLQDVLISKATELPKLTNERLRSFSTKAIPLQQSQLTFCSSRTTSSKDDFTEYLSSLSVFETLQSETENETS